MKLPRDTLGSMMMPRYINEITMLMVSYCSYSVTKCEVFAGTGISPSSSSIAALPL